MLARLITHTPFLTLCPDLSNFAQIVLKTPTILHDSVVQTAQRVRLYCCHRKDFRTMERQRSSMMFKILYDLRTLRLAINMLWVVSLQLLKSVGASVYVIRV